MFLSELPVLQALKTMVEGLTFSPALTAVHISPDDTVSVDSYTVPFAVVGVMEDSDRIQGQSAFITPTMSYSVFIRVFLSDELLMPSTSAFDTLQQTARATIATLNSEIYSEGSFGFGGARIVAPVNTTINYLAAEAREYTGVQVVIPVEQEVAS